nr:hypothetical protein [uncultured Cellulosilyticum sp.]
MRNCKEDKNIKIVLNQEVEDIEVSPDLFNKIRKNIYEEEQRNTMKNKGFSLGRKKRVALVAGLCLIVGSITAVAAATSGSWISRSHTAYNSFPTQEKVENDNGFLPKYVESLPGGFEYKKASIGKGEMTDEAGKLVTKTKEITFMYSNGEKERQPISLNTMLVDEKYLNHEGETKLEESYKGIDLYYYNQTYKFVPANYVLTAEDNKAMAAGALEVSYGSDKVEVQQVQAISWYEDGISYNIMGNDYNFNIDELVNMAQTVIDAE